MATTFNELEQRALRWLEAEYAAKGRGPDTLDGDCTTHADFMAHLGVSLPQYRKLLARFESLGFVSYNHSLVEAHGGFLFVEPGVVAAVRDLDDAAQRQPLPQPKVGFIMSPTFNELERKALWYLKAEYLEKGTRPTTMHDPATFHKDVMAHFGLSLPHYRELIGRFEALGIVEFNPHAVASSNGLLHVQPYVIEVVRQLDEAAQRNEQAKQKSNKIDVAKEWAFSRWWIVGPVIVLLVVVWLINHFKPILEWFGVKK